MISGTDSVTVSMKKKTLTSIQCPFYRYLRLVLVLIPQIYGRFGRPKLVLSSMGP